MSVSASSNNNSPEARAMRAEAESQKRIQEAKARAEQAIRDIDSESKVQTDQYVRSSEKERQRNETALKQQSAEGYDHLRKLKQQQSKELHQSKSMGDEELRNMTEAQKEQIQETSRAAQKKISELQHQLGTQTAYENRTAAEKLEKIRETNSRSVEGLVNHNQQALQNLSQNTTALYEEKRDLYNESREMADRRFEDQIKKTNTDHTQHLSKQNKKTIDDLQKLKQEHAQKLAAFSARSEDPFYRLVNVDALVQETPNSYVLTARIPEHEQKMVQVSVQGDRVLISGARQNKESIDLGKGRKQTTAAFQSFTETFPVSWPIDSKNVSKTVDGDNVIFEFPKKKTYSDSSKKKVVAEAQVRVERPQFPDNLTLQSKKEPIT